MSEKKLEPCPFCGHEFSSYVSREWPDSNPRVYCSCGARGPYGIKSDVTAIRAWNRRDGSKGGKEL